MNRSIMMSNRVTVVDFVELDMFDSDVILGMDWLHVWFFFLIDRRIKVGKFNF